MTQKHDKKGKKHGIRKNRRTIQGFAQQGPVSYTHLDVYKRQMYKDSAVKKCQGIENDVKVVLNQEGRYFGRWIIRV